MKTLTSLRTADRLLAVAALGFAGTCATTMVEALAGDEAGGDYICYIEVDDCTVCYHAGARIHCSSGGGGVIECPDVIIGTDPPYRSVEESDSAVAEKFKRSENYGSCTWQPRRPATGGGCEDDGPQQSVNNVMGEETHGGTCGSGGGGET